MRIRFTSRLSLLLLSFVAATLIFPAMAFAEPIAPDGTTASTPTIASDKADYGPGETVTLSGSGWQPGESVNVVVNDDAGQTWNRNVNVTADASGNITDSFNLPDWFVATYSVKATGASGAVATTFTDANFKVAGTFDGSTTDSYTLRFQRYSGTASGTLCGGTLRSGDATPQTEIVTTADDTIQQSGQNCAELNAPATSAQGRPFIKWTDSSGSTVPDTVVGTGSLAGHHRVAVDYPPAGTDKTYKANYGRGTTTTVARTGGPNPSTYGTALTFTATVTATGGHPSGVGTVTFKDGTNTISGCSNVPLTGNTAMCVTTKLAAGTHNNITAEYSGTTTGSPLFSSSTSSPISHTVNQKALTVTGVTANNKVYDGGTSATLNTGSATLSGVESGDTVTLVKSGASGTFGDKNVGTGKTVTTSGFALSGTDSGNYTLTQPTATADITAKPITVTADPKTKVYGDNDPALTYSITSGNLVTGDSLSGSLTRVAGESVAGGPYAIQQGSLTAGNNYNLTFNGANLTITARPITVKADAKTKILGAPDPALTYQVTAGNLVGTDSFSGSLNRDPGETIGTYAIKQNTLTAGSNYNITYVGANLTIVFNYSGFLQPINDTAHQTGLLESKFKLGQTIPVKFQLKDAAGNLVQQTTNPIFTKSGNRGACDAATTVETPPVVTPDANNQYVYTGGHYQYNFSTKGLTSGEYRIYANLADGTQPYVDICLTK